VRLDTVSKRFGDVRAVDGLSLSVPRGTVTALLGPNGAGKTTTVSMCEGFLRPDSGTARVLGHDPWTDQAVLRPRMGVMLQAGGAHGSARAGEMLHLVARCAAHPHDPDELLDTVGLTAAARTPVRRLSGGQVQRLSLAMALVGRPELLFLDEPTAGMDPQARHLVWDVLRAARSDGVTLVLTTHLLDEVEWLADNVLIIDHGRAVARGTPAELTGSSTEIRFDSSPGLDLAALRAALPAADVAEFAPGRYRVAGELPDDAAAGIAVVVTGAGAPLTHLQTARRTLDDVYLQLTGEAVRS
jgi:ABC-2 type transport system ATP-binding protein